MSETTSEKRGIMLPLVYHEICMERFRRAVRQVVVGWAISSVSLVGVILYLLLS